jgi:hypothetical protein
LLLRLLKPPSRLKPLLRLPLLLLMLPSRLKPLRLLLLLHRLLRSNFSSATKTGLRPRFLLSRT